MKPTKLTSMLVSMFIMLCMNLAFAQETPEEVSEKLYQEFKANGIEKALKSYEQSPAKGDQYTFLSEPLNVLGYRLMDEGKLEAAEMAFKAQIDEYPDEANPYDSYADLLMEKGDEEGAKKHYQKAIDLSATIEDAEAKDQMLTASKSKLAKLDGAGTDLAFMEGKWKSSNYSFKDGEKVLRNRDQMEFMAMPDHSVYVIKNFNEAGDYTGTRVITYDAMDEEYDMVWTGTSLQGFNSSKMKIEKSTPEEVVFVETWKENGKDMKIKHIMKRKSGEVEWEMYDLTLDNKNPVAQNILTKN